MRSVEGRGAKNERNSEGKRIELKRGAAPEYFRHARSAGNRRGRAGRRIFFEAPR